MPFATPSRTIAAQVACCMVALGVLAAPGPARADEKKLTVMATVLRHVRLEMGAQPASLVVTPDDLARGYVDVPNAGQVAIQSNSPAGYMLAFASQSQSDLVRQVRVAGLGKELEVGRDGGFVVQPASGNGLTRTTLKLGFRFLLAETARAGTYAWPMHLSVTPL